MDIVTDTNVVKHLIRLSDRTKSMEPTLKQKLIKPIFNPDIKSSPMPRSTPEEQGISSSYLCDFIDELRLAGLRTGDIFGEMTCMGGYPRAATVRAEEDTVVLRLHVAEDDLRALGDEAPHLGLALSTCPAADQRDLSFEASHRSSSFVVGGPGTSGAGRSAAGRGWTVAHRAP